LQRSENAEQLRLDKISIDKQK